MRPSALIFDRHGNAAAEMALVLPLLLVLTLGPIELGNYFMSEHALVKGLRDGAIYAAHQDVSNYNCDAQGPVPTTVRDNTENVVRGGQLTTGNDRLPNWDSATTDFTVTFTCVTEATDGTPLSGMYTLNDGNVPIVTVSASLPYQAVVKNLGLATLNLTLSASQQATVQGM